MKKEKDAVVRIKQSSFKRLKALMNKNNEKLTLNELMEKLLDSMENFENSEMIYISGNISYGDLLDARGKAIVDAVKSESKPIWPKIAVIVGEDSGV